MPNRAAAISALRFPAEILSKLEAGKALRIRAGNGSHRFIGIWVVVVQRRVFVRSWSIKPDGWYRAFCEEPSGAIQMGDHTIPVVAVPVRTPRILDAIDKAYLEKYNTPGAIKYARDLGSAPSRASTLELRPFHAGAGAKASARKPFEHP